jgi:3-oxoacyl-[acyl-carrier protein] reductase
MGYEPFMQMLAIHVGGTFLCTRAAVPLMLDGGSVVNLSSIAGIAGWGPAHYAAAKGAILGLTRSLARELGPHRIRVNAVAPGVIDTPMVDQLASAMLDPLVGMTPMGRIGEAAEIASTVLFLAGNDGAFVTGQWISPNGGLITS